MSSQTKHTGYIQPGGRRTQVVEALQTNISIDFSTKQIPVGKALYELINVFSEIDISEK